MPATKPGVRFSRAALIQRLKAPLSMIFVALAVLLSPAVAHASPAQDVRHPCAACDTVGGGSRRPTMVLLRSRTFGTKRSAGDGRP